jgi:hypothetical protein
MSDGTTRALVWQIEGLGYTVTTIRSGGSVELRAASRTDQSQTFVARNADGDGAEDEYLAACRLAEMVGIRLRG